MTDTAEGRRLADHRARTADWKNWGPYLAERAWGTVREDYSSDGNAWAAVSHDDARRRAYRWNEDGLGGVSDRHQYHCLSIALWNERDPFLKERLFGLTAEQGNHGEDVKEQYFFVDATPTHSYLKMTYAYPQDAFPYDDLVAENARRDRSDFEYELLDTGALDRWFAVDIEYAKAGADDVLCRVTVTNRGPDRAACHVLPQIWFRNTWSWGYEAGPLGDVAGTPRLHANRSGVTTEHPTGGAYEWVVAGDPIVMVTENETGGPHAKDAFHRRVVDGEESAVAPSGSGSKAAAWFRLDLDPGSSDTVLVRMARTLPADPFAEADRIFSERIAEADEFYDTVHAPGLGTDERAVQRQAFAGLIWSKQLYYFDVPQWLDGDPVGPAPPAERLDGRNADWRHLNAFDILSMPDSWEYPWFAAWDLAFHAVPLAMIDPEFAKRQLTLMTRAWYQHANGQMPAYEWSFGDVNPPVHAWAAWQVFELDAAATGVADHDWLEALFHKLLLNFTWWVNRKDLEGNNVFQGGFLGLDNVSVFDRSAELPTGGHIDQSDGTAWMAFFTLGMLRMSLELALRNHVYQDLATKFYEHFLSIAQALAAPGHSLWDEDDGFFYDVLRLPDGHTEPLRVRSIVGLLPLVAVTFIEQETLDALPDFARRMRWMTEHRPRLAGNMASIEVPGEGQRILLSVLPRDRLERVLGYLFDEDEFLSPYGVRSLSRHHLENPYSLDVDGTEYAISYEAAESGDWMFGGNSNWRGPVWLPINYLIIEALELHHRYYGAGLTVAVPTGSQTRVTLAEAAGVLARRVTSLFADVGNGSRPMHGGVSWYGNQMPGHVHFPEYFNGDDGAGLGAMHQTGWTALVADLLDRYGPSMASNRANNSTSSDR